MSTSAAPALEHLAVHQSELVLFFTLLQLAVIVLAGRVGSALARRWGQNAAVGEIVIGILLGPSLLGWLAPGLFGYIFHSAPGEPMQVLSQIGLILLMFQIGLEFDFGHLGEKRHRRAVLWVAAASLALPFALGFGLGWHVAPFLGGAGVAGMQGGGALMTALFVATAFSITALPILGRILIDFGLTRRPLGVVAISAAAINDVAGWLLLALVTMLAVAGFAPLGFALNMLAVAAFAAFCWWGLRPPLRRLIARMQQGAAASAARHAAPGAGADARHAAAPGAPGNAAPNAAPNALPDALLGVLLALIFAGAMATYKLGIFAIFGGFMLGVLLHDEHALAAAWKARMGQFVTVFFLPIFFTYTGLRTHIDGLDSPQLWGWCLLITLLATAGKFCGSYLAARHVGMPPAEAKALGIMMNTRALMELVVINVGHDLGVISPQLFTMLVIMAIVSTVITTPLLRRWLKEDAPGQSARA